MCPTMHPWCPEPSFQGFNHSGSFLPWSCSWSLEHIPASLWLVKHRPSSRRKMSHRKLLVPLPVGSQGHCASGLSAATGQHCSGVTAYGFLWAAWHWEHSSVRAESLFHLSVQSPRLTRRRWWQRLRNTPSHPVHDGWLPCAPGFNTAHPTASKLPSWCAHCSAKSNKVGHQQCKPLPGFTSPHFPLQLQGAPLRHKKLNLQGHLSLPGQGRTGWWCPLPFPARSLMAAMNQQPVDLSKAFLHFNPIDRDYCLEQELRGEPCQQQILITDNIDGAFSWIMKGRALCFDVCLQNLELLRV